MILFGFLALLFVSEISRRRDHLSLVRRCDGGEADVTIVAVLVVVEVVVVPFLKRGKPP